ncbi:MULTISPECIES: exodeoxyribonuclease VII small subunit [Fulvivirga]|uniref:Exodeoxyribonuclease VII small subunit n=1 Tax=Fulvivirga lutea TaxID=2810512 RepID=A0A974WDW2_9BACT|nr:exodeoxyribonuclease VII small subunit [Fulvivirga lutea]QSE96388.1 exodeoxyribonuclease VII small subunit [Fulvivirga lutea]
MKKIKTYTEALTKLEKTVAEIESGELTVDELTDKVKEATELVNICRKKLRSVEEDINKSLDELN